MKTDDGTARPRKWKITIRTFVFTIHDYHFGRNSSKSYCRASRASLERRKLHNKMRHN